MVQDFVKLTAQRILWKNHKTDKSLLNLPDFGKLLVNSALTGKIGHLGFSRCKTTIVGMDIKRSHIEAGLVHPRERRDFSMPETSRSATGIGEGSEVAAEVEDLEILDFDQLARELIEDASEDIEELDADEELPPIPLTIRIPLQAIHSALQDTPQSRSAATKIPLKSLFIFPENPNATSELAYFWKGGIQNLEKEMAVHEVLCSSEHLELEHAGEVISWR